MDKIAFCWPTFYDWTVEGWSHHRQTHCLRLWVQPYETPSGYFYLGWVFYLSFLNDVIYNDFDSVFIGCLYGNLHALGFWRLALRRYRWLHFVWHNKLVLFLVFLDFLLSSLAFIRTPLQLDKVSLDLSLFLKVRARHTPTSVANQLHDLSHAAVIQDAGQPTLDFIEPLPQKHRVCGITESILVYDTLDDASRKGTALSWRVLRHERFKIASVLASNSLKHLSMCELIEYFRLSTDSRDV